MEDISGLEAEIDKLYEVDIEDQFVLPDASDDDEEPADAEKNSSGYDEDDDGEEGEYKRSFGLELLGLYVNDEGQLTLEYEDNAQETVARLFNEGERLPRENDDLPLNINPSHADDMGMVEYRKNTVLNYSEGTQLPQRDEPQSSVLTLEYETPDVINGQRTYQRVVFEADRDGETLYQLTARKLGEAGMEVSAEYDSDFESTLLTSINGKREGAEGNFNEFYRNGEIGENAVDKEVVKKGDIIEWRYAEESDGTCGGVPDFMKIKEMLYSQTAGNDGFYSGGLKGSTFSLTPQFPQFQYA